MKTLFCLAFILLLFVGCSNDQTKANENFQQELLELHNEERIRHGLKPLSLNKDLCKYSQKHAEKMALKKHMHHSNLGQVEKIEPNKNWDWRGENVAWGQKTADSVVRAWMLSPGHRWNILGTNFKQVGFGLARDSHGNNYWCTVFSD